MRRFSRVGGECLCYAEISAGHAVVPGKGVFVPTGPQKTEKKGAGRQQVADAPPQHLPRLRRVTIEAGDLQSSRHHAGSCAAENGEQREILQVNDGEGGGINGGAELADGELAAERAEQHKKATIGKQQTN